jgi:hypothetical protein
MQQWGIFGAAVAAAGMLLLAGQPAQAVQCPSGLLFPGVNPSLSSDPQVDLMGFTTFQNPMIDANYLKKYVTPVPNALSPGFIYSPS